MTHRKTLIALIGITALTVGIAVSEVARPGITRPLTDDNGITHIPVTFTGGHETDPRDHGRPVVLVAAGLNVPSDLFRKAFNGVTPAPAGRGPSGDEGRQNKAALLKVLAPDGVTNDRLDTVSDYYRYRPESGRLWTHSGAFINANVRAGTIVSFTIVAAGTGYSTPPEISVPGFADLKLKATVVFSTNLDKNGSIAAVDVIPNAS